MPFPRTCRPARVGEMTIRFDTYVLLDMESADDVPLIREIAYGRLVADEAYVASLMIAMSSPLRP